MKTIVITTTANHKYDIIEKYSIGESPAGPMDKIKVKVEVDDSSSDIFKNLAKDPDVIDWEFDDETKKAESVSPEALEKVSVVDVWQESLAKKLREGLDLKDMNSVVEFCFEYRRSLEENPGSTPEWCVEDCLKKGTPESTDIWDGLSEGIIKMILVLMGHGPAEFSKTMSTGLLKAGYYYRRVQENNLNVMITKEKFLQLVFTDNP